jgi:hypothetical protein
MFVTFNYLLHTTGCILESLVFEFGCWGLGQSVGAPCKHQALIHGTGAVLDELVHLDGPAE